MRAARIAALVTPLVAMSSAGCLRSTTFQCLANADCVDGVCESTGYCSFADSSCEGGRRYADHSDQFSGQCVGAVEGPDASGDGSDIDGNGTIDARIDAGPNQCPGTYMSIGGSAHVYRLISLADNPTAQAVICAGEGGYLVVPDDMAELQAVTSLAGNVWVGVNDRAQEGVFVTQLGNPATYLPWAAGQPDDDNPGEDCVAASAALQYSDERCGQARAAVCECEP